MMNKKRTICLMVAAIAAGAFAASPYGVCAHLTGGERNERPRTLAAVRMAGIGMVRCDFWWSMLEKANGSFDFALTDAIVAEAKKTGVSILPILCYDHKAHPHPKDDQGPWRRYVRAVAERYAADCPIFEVWNEENSSRFWGGKTPAAAEYLEVLKAAFEEIRAVAPGAKVAIGGFAGVPWTFIEDLLAAGAGDFFDIMNVHPYCIPNAPEYHYTGEGGFPRRLRALMAKYGCGDREIWITEFGWPTNDTDPNWPVGTKEFYSKVGVDEARQAAYLARASALALAEGVAAILPYELRDPDRGGDRFDRESRFGLLHDDFSPKPAYAAYTTLIAARPAGSAHKPLPLTDGADLYFPQWKCSDGTPAGMVWTTGPARTVPLRFALGPALESGDASASRLRFRTHLGAELHPEKTPDGAYALPLSGDPVYFSGGELVAPASSETHNPTTQGANP